MFVVGLGLSRLIWLLDGLGLDYWWGFSDCLQERFPWHLLFLWCVISVRLVFLPMDGSVIGFLIALVDPERLGIGFIRSNVAIEYTDIRSDSCQ